MASRRYPDEERYQTEQGEFAAPAKMQASTYQSLLNDRRAEQRQFVDDGFVFDEETNWNKPLAPRYEQPERPVPRPRQPVREPSRRRRRGGWRSVVCVLIICLSLAATAVLGVMMMPQLSGYFWKDFPNFAFVNGELMLYDAENVAAYKQHRAYMDRDVIYPGIFVDGVHVGDLTIEEARAMLSASGADLPNAFSVTVAIGNQTWTIDPTNVPAQRNLGNVLEKAYAIGRTNSTVIHTSMQTPFRERTDRAVALRTGGVNLLTTASYDHDALRSVVDEIADYVTRPPVDAQIQSFDYNTRTFSFTQSQPGVTLDREMLYQKLCTALDQWQNGTTVTVDPVVTEPQVTTQQLTERFTMIAAYTTKTTNESARNTNIDLACKAINGTALMPGETFSFNEATGQRTTDKGYQSAGAIAAGQSIEEVGGGICQVSSTLFNAVARADLEIVSRSPHAWPSTYVGIGEDATVNWPNLDFKFKNNTGSPVFVITYYKDRQMSAEIWGMSLGEGVSINLESVVVQTTEPPEDSKYVFNPELEYGTSERTVKARTGYKVETWQVWYENGVETRRELLHTSTYRPYQQVIEYNW